MISFNYECDFKLSGERNYKNWISEVIIDAGFKVGEISYIFCDDAYLLEINKNYLQHDDYTDIITFDNSIGKKLQADIFISVIRVDENAQEFSVERDEELRRVMAHGILHLIGNKDKSEDDSTKMRILEEAAMKMFHVEQKNK